MESSHLKCFGSTIGLSALALEKSVQVIGHWSLLKTASMTRGRNLGRWLESHATDEK
jgi:hypothetical protein